MSSIVVKAAALSNAKRLQILEWLREPSEYFGPDHPIDEKIGVCGLYIAEKLGISPATASAHLKVLTHAGFVRPHRLGKFTYFKRIDAAFSDFAKAIRKM